MGRCYDAVGDPTAVRSLDASGNVLSTQTATYGRSDLGGERRVMPEHLAVALRPGTRTDLQPSGVPPLQDSCIEFVMHC